MKKWGIIIVSALIGGCILITLSLVFIFRDYFVQEYLLESSYRIEIWAKGYWDGSIPVYFKIKKEGQSTLKGGVFSYHLPEEIDSKTLGLVVQKRNNIIFFYHRNDPHLILAMVDLTEGFVYPGRKIALETSYYSQRDRLFSRLQEILKNDKLMLWR